MADKSLRINLLANTKGLTAGLDKASSKLQAFGAKTKAIGQSLKSIQLPLLLAGGASVKMAADFDRSMTQIKSLVGIAGNEVDAMGVKVKELASDMGKDAGEAADALFYITSAGLRGKEAMDVLQQSLKASAIGLGETKTVADLATSAMNAYGSDVLNASNATDVMVAAVREGKLEASELAGSMGRVLPVASAMGVSFNEVGAAFAALSRTGTNAAEAATQIRGILTSILKPTKDASDALAEMGLSTDILRKNIKERGLLDTLQILKENFDGNDDAAQRVFGNVRALSGIMDLLGANSATTNDIFKRMNNTLGMTDNAFKSTSESASFKLNKALKEAKNSFTEIGSVLLVELLPYIKQLANWIKGAVKEFKSWSKENQALFVKVTALITILPTVLTLVGNLSLAFGKLGKALVFVNGTKAFGGFKTALMGLGAPVAIAVAAIGGLLFAFDQLTDKIAGNLSLWEKLKITFSSGGFGSPTGVAQAVVSMGAESIIKSTKEQAKASADAMSAARAEFGKTIPPISLPFGRNDKVNSPRIIGETVKVITKGIAQVGDTITQVAENTGVLNTKFVEFKQLGEGMSNVVMSLGYALSDSFEAMFEGENFFKSLGNAILGIIKRLIAAAAAAAILSAVLSGLGIGIIGNTTTDFKSLFGNISGFGKFANGGIVSSPTLGLMGEYAGARSNPEVIAPLDKLKSMIGDRGAGNVNVTGEFRLQGQDLVVALQRANKQRNRLG